ncbi:ribonucleases P/MRP protein subunit POP1-domain-containing protein [Thelonectria olida]|uniref:Ribonucleases P/MRP protein subunit POP1-domain-containing protein n=1 Tax=Thelonectria olida TaxID=1576542 RepID=A0A9P8W5X5_9HYPO|nr:ribonucleases P/MRP protein subunit POP1-domain-containing protein [Thelonectria olida]
MAPGSGSGDSAGQGANKRKAGNDARSRMHTARSIPAQPAEAALKDGELDLQAFLAAHEFEIRSLEQSMETSKAVGASRAFQKVPRGLRRRTASHNPKRVPHRLRARAWKELGDDKTPIVEARKRKPRTTRGRIRAETAKKLKILAARKRRARETQAKEKGTNDNPPKDLAVIGRKPRPKIRRNGLNEPPTPKAKFRKRQLNKTWLPTHVWHTKRARMTDPKDPLWRFATPLTPNEKLYRPTHRAQGDRGALVWDTSYLSTIGLYGNTIGIERVLKKLGVVNEKGRKWRLGSRSWTGCLSRVRDGERRDIGPSTIQWNPEPSTNSTTQDPKKTQRQVLLRIHPSAFLELFNELLRLVKMESPRLYIEDLRFEIGSIELTGPASTETLLSVLSPYQSKGHAKSKHGDLFVSLSGLTNSASLPAGAVLGFSVQDPRLRYPPRRLEIVDDPDAQIDLLEKIAAWPAEDNLQPFGLFDRDMRYKAACLPSQKSINKRKTDNAPGTPLKATSLDPPIPILLTATRSGAGKQAQGNWTLLAPWGCILPIWYSIVHVPLTSGSNPRFAGLNQTRQVAFERGLPWFPGDFVGTDAGLEWELEERKKRKRVWDRRPKSKRIEWDSLDLGGGRKGEIGDGHANDFEILFGVDRSRLEPTLDSTGDEVDAMDIDKDESASTKLESTPSITLNQVSKDFFDKLLTLPSPPTPPSNAILNVRISILGRGIATSCARIYRLPAPPTTPAPSSSAEVPATMPPESSSSSSSLPGDLRAQWLARIPSVNSTKNKASKGSKAHDLESLKRRIALELIAEPDYPPAPVNQFTIGGHALVPDVEDLIGFVTTGAYCLAEGRGVAMGSIAVEKVVGDVKKDDKEGRLCIVRNAGENVGWIARWEVI